ncbi:MAG TPA: DNA polymerase III subunit alpha [Flavobacteriales bacterium]|jgi:error-prone DNA polymerase|nr:DNA polymerase III subunit alpha [Flavobacteriales bacterium]
MLNTHTYYSFHYGTVSPKQLVELIKTLGYNVLALTDINFTSAHLDFVRLCQKEGIKPILGVDFRDGAQQKFIALAKNNNGLQEINTYLAELRHSKTPPPDCAPEFKSSFVIYPFENAPEKLREFEYVGVRYQNLTHLRLYPSAHPIDKMVALHTFSFRNKKDFNAHRLLRAIHNNTLLSKLPKSEEGQPHDRFIDYDELKNLFESRPELLENSEKMLRQCSIHFEFGENAPHQNLKHYTGSAEEDWKLVKKLCKQGVEYRYPNASEDIFTRLDKELDIIRQKGYLAYFLMAWDMVSYAQKQGYFYVGRGSGANSIVAYLLRITDVDPIELDLYFERFINLFRRNPPDFDIDFSWKDRPDMTRYIFERFGAKRTALLGSYVTFQYRAVVRELGKVFGLPKHEIDTLSSGRVNFNKLDSVAQLVLKYGQYIQGFPNHLSVHAGGIIISEKPIHYFTATDLPPKGFPTTHFDMIVAEDVGLYKFDILGQRGLGKIKDALTVVKENHPDHPEIDIHDIPRFKRDPKIKSLLRQGKAIGCFYVESPAMRMLLNKLKVDDYLGLVAASSIIRPGVAKSGMMREYILRFRYPERRKDAHPVMLDIMPDTFGVMVYQEDVIKVAHYFAGLSLGEADVLRRGMSGKYRSREEFQQVRNKFFANCAEKGHSSQLSAEIWRQVESFAGYAFAKGHSASYAVESYQSLFLKAHYPLEYMVATINNGGGFYRADLYLHEARMHGAKIHPPCVNKSDALTRIEGKDIYLGLAFIHGMETKVAHAIVEERKRNGKYISFDDFADRLSISLDDIENLIRIDGLRFTSENKRTLLWKAHLWVGKTRKPVDTNRLFSSEPRKYEIPGLHSTLTENLFDQIELLGFPLGDPWLLLEEESSHSMRSQHLSKHLNEIVEIEGYLVTTKSTTTVQKKHMQFGTFLDRDGQFIDTVHFPPVVKKYPLSGRGIYRITGKVTEEFEFYSIDVQSINRLSFIPDPRYSEEGIRPGVKAIQEHQQLSRRKKKNMIRPIRPK